MSDLDGYFLAGLAALMSTILVVAYRLENWLEKIHGDICCLLEEIRDKDVEEEEEEEEEV